MTEVYPGFPKIPRFNRDVSISEKIDGTNALIEIKAHMFGTHAAVDPVEGETVVLLNEDLDEDGNPKFEYTIRAGSRNRWTSTARDNAGFAKYVLDNRFDLVQTLREGRHYGEWWGQGIQRNYGLKEKRLSLFNTFRWSHLDGTQVKGLYVVPELYRGPLISNYGGNIKVKINRVENILEGLRLDGSKAAPGFMNPEGVIIYHEAAKQYFKATIVDDEKPKGIERPDLDPNAIGTPTEGVW